MLEDQVANLLQRYLGNYVRGLNKEALKISVWKGDVELKNMQLKPEALNALKLPVKVKAGFLGSVRLKVPWSRLGQDPVLVYLDRIYILAEPETEVEGSTEDALQEAKKSRVREMEMKLLERAQQLKTEMNKSWLGSLISTIIGNLKLSISNIHVRYEDLESNPGHPFSAGVMLGKLSAATVDDKGTETFVTGVSLDGIHKLVELDQLALYLDSDVTPWHLEQPWEDLPASDWVQVFRYGTVGGKPADRLIEEHSYVLQPVSGSANYSKLHGTESATGDHPVQKAVVNLDDVTLCLTKDGYRDVLKLADNFAFFNQRLKNAHYRPHVPVKSNPRSWWKYAFRAVSDQMKKASGKLSWEQVLRYSRMRKRYISLYASVLKADLNRPIVEDNKEIEEMDKELDIDLIIQWRMVAHKFVQQSVESEAYLTKQKAKKSWWSLGWNGQSPKDESGDFHFTDDDWEQLNRIIGYREGDDTQSIVDVVKPDVVQTFLEIHMKRNATKLGGHAQECLAELSCNDLDCSVKLYEETKVFDLKLGSYRLSSPNGLLAESATSLHSLSGVFCYKPFDAKVDWSLVVKASPCYMTYLKDSIDEVINFFETNDAVSPAIALETAAAVQMTIDEVKRSAQKQVNRALKDHARFFLDLDIAAPKVKIPTAFCPDNVNATNLLLDFGNLMIRSQDDYERKSAEELDMYLQFDLILSDVSAFLVDGDYHWSGAAADSVSCSKQLNYVSLLPVVDKCGVILRLHQIRLENPLLPSTRLSVRLPSLGFHFSPARYHRLMHVVRIFQEDSQKSDLLRPWDRADFEGWLSLLTRKGMGNREAVWQRRYICLVGSFFYVLENPGSKSYNKCISLRGKQVQQLPAEFVGGIPHIFAIYGAANPINKVVEDVNALILRCDSDDAQRSWQKRLQAAIYLASDSATITTLSESSSDHEDSETDLTSNSSKIVPRERVFLTGVLDELKIRFNYSQGLGTVLLAQESRLFEFRAIGGQVEFSIREKDLLIGTVLKSLEIEDLVACSSASQTCFLVRSVIRSAETQSSFDDVKQSLDSSEGDDNFYEASENLIDSDPGFQFENSSYKLPNFSHVAGLLPSDSFQTRMKDSEATDSLDSFIKAQVVIYDQNSTLYNNVDMQVMVTLATLSFFCRRPTIVAVMDFVNAINPSDKSSEPGDSSSLPMAETEAIGDDVVENKDSRVTEEPAVKGLLGKGKSRVIFDLILKMARAQISLMNENGSKLATLSQDNLFTNIKVFPSSFSINAALGNLRISDDSLHENHAYFWMCDMRNPGGSSFVELLFSSFNVDDDDYEGYEYSLFGQLSEVRIVYLNRFVQEVASYFLGLVPNNSKGIVKVKDQNTNSEKWFTTSEIEGSPALKLDLSLRKPIILMPRRTDSPDYLKLDVVHITVRNTCQWLSGSKNDIHAVHMDILTVQVEDINLNVGTGTELSESIIQDVKGMSLVIRRSLRDLSHQVPNMEVAIKIEKLKAALSNREYQIVTECATSNISEIPRTIPPLKHVSQTISSDVIEPVLAEDPGNVISESQNQEVWISMEVTVIVNLVELSLHAGLARDTSLATMQIIGLWLLFKSDNQMESFLSATLKGFTVIDDREGTADEFRLAIGMPHDIGNSTLAVNENQLESTTNDFEETDIRPVPTMLILDAKLGQHSTTVSLCIQRPQMLVALDFLLAVVEFFVPSVGNMLSNDENKNPIDILDAIILDQPVYRQTTAEISLSPLRPLVADHESFDHFIYDGNGGTIYLRDRQGFHLSSSSKEPMIYVGHGKKLQFRNVLIKDGRFLDSCIWLGSYSGYSALRDDQVLLESEDKAPHLASSPTNDYDRPSQDIAVPRSSEFVLELQAIGPELTFYNTSKDVGLSPILSNKLLHAQLDAFSRFVMKGDTMEATVNVLSFMMESNGIKILEPFDTSLKFSNASGKTNIHASVSNIFMNCTFSILKLFLAVEEDILTFLQRTSQKITVTCSQFDKVGTIKNVGSDQIYAFWRPRAPPGFAILGDYLTPLDKPPTKGVVAVNTNLVRVKRPISYKLIWPPAASFQERTDSSSDGISTSGDYYCSIWLPEAPKGYVAMGCVVAPGNKAPLPSSTSCIWSHLVSPCSLRDCVTIDTLYQSSLAFWRVDNCVGSFLPAEPSTLSPASRAFELRHIKFGLPEPSFETSNLSNNLASSPSHVDREIAVAVSSGRCFEAVASFQLIWWNQGTSARKKLSIWRPVVPQGMVYFGDIAVRGHEPPSSCVVLHDSGDGILFKAPLEYQLVGQIKKQRGAEGISFWMPQPPPGFVSLGCVASKGSPKQNGFSVLRCMRSDMVTGDQFLEESVWDTSDAKFGSEHFSLWTVDNELGTFLVRSGFKKPPRRFALKLADPSAPSGSDDTVVDAEIGTFSMSIFDDYGGLMVPLFNLSLSGLVFSLRGRADYLASTVSFSLNAKSFNDTYDAWEPLIEPVDGFVRYQYNINSPGSPSQLRLTATGNLNLNVSVSNCNMIIQAYASWSNLSSVHTGYKKGDVVLSTVGAIPVTDVHHRANFYILPRNKLGRDIFIQATETRGLSHIIRLTSGEMKPVKVPVLNNMLDSHSKGKICAENRKMVTVIIADGQFPKTVGLASNMYTSAIRLVPSESMGADSLIHQQSARTSGAISVSSSSGYDSVNWSEIFFFKVETEDNCSLELIVTDMGRGQPIGFFTSRLNEIARNVQGSACQYDYQKHLTWIDLHSEKSMNVQEDEHAISFGRLRFAVLFSPSSEVEETGEFSSDGKQSGFIQISPAVEGPWTTVRLNYAAPAACWRLGNDVVASEVIMNDDQRFLNIRSLVSVHNNTDFVLDLRLVPKSSDQSFRSLTDVNKSEGSKINGREVQTEEFFETEKYDPTNGWIGCSNNLEDDDHPKAMSGVVPPSGWVWLDDWHLDTSFVSAADGWVYSPDVKSLKWPESFDHQKIVNGARQRRWIRNRNPIPEIASQEMHIGSLEPGDIMPLPLPGLTLDELYALQVRPLNHGTEETYSWSYLVERLAQSEGYDGQRCSSGLNVSSLSESDELLYCEETRGTSSNAPHKLWFCATVQAAEIAKDILSDPIQDWSIVIKSPLCISNYLPLSAEYSIYDIQATGHFVACARGIFYPGETVKIHTADIRNLLFLSMLPQRGWLPIQEAVLISHPNGLPSKTTSLRSSITGRIVQLILEQNYERERPLVPRAIRVYAPYWFFVARCPPLTCRMVDLSGKKQGKSISLPFQSRRTDGEVLGEITAEEIYEGHTIASALNFKLLSFSVSITESERESHFGPPKDLSPLGDMDGSLDICAYDADGNCMHLFISTKPCPYQSVPTKVISIRPFMTFTNRLGQDIFIKLNSEDQPKVLRASDTRVSFMHREVGEPNKIQVRLEETEWSYPVQITKEDTVFLVLRTQSGNRRFLRAEVRGYEEGSRFIVVFRLGPTDGPFRVENRTSDFTIRLRQAGFGEDAWVTLVPLSTVNFSWEDPYGQKFVDAQINNDHRTCVGKLELERIGVFTVGEAELTLQFHVAQIGYFKIVQFTDYRGPDLAEDSSSLTQTENGGNSALQKEVRSSTAMELIVELGFVGISVVDHRPKELLYLYLERVFLSYSSGYDDGTTSRLKLIFGYLQLDNQLPLTLMPVLLAPEPAIDMQHPVFKMTITARNENADGVQVYQYIYIRVSEKVWRIDIHEPIMWALVSFFNYIHLDRLPDSSNVTEVDPEIRLELIDISEVRLKVSLETAPAERPQGVLGIWSPVLSALGNAFKIQVHLRRVMQRDRFMRKSSVVPAIKNRIWRDLIHNPLHLLFSVDILGMTSSTLASLGKGFAKLSTDGQFLQLRSKQVSSRRITGVGQGIIQGTEALAQGFAFGVSGVVTKPVESARENGLLGLAHGLGRAFLGFLVQPVSGALDFVSLTVDGIGASCSKCLEVLNNKGSTERIRCPRAIHADCILGEYNEREAVGQMILYLGEASRRFGCTEIFKEPSKFAWSDYYEAHFMVPYQRIVLVTNKRVMLLQCRVPEKMAKKPSKIMWDVPWEELMSLELAKAGCRQPSHLLLHLKSFRRSENFVRVMKCHVEEPEETEPQAVRICAVIRRMWKAYFFNSKSIVLKVPASQGRAHFALSDSVRNGSPTPGKAIIKSRGSLSSTSNSDRFVNHSIDFVRIWSSEQELKGRCRLGRKQVVEDGGLCSIWRPICPDGYISIGDVAHVGSHPPNVAAVYRNMDRLFAVPVGYDLVWRNCSEDYKAPLSIWHPRAPEGFASLGCVAMAGFEEPHINLVSCVAESLAEQTDFEEQKIWSAPNSYPWACHIYQVKSDALHFVALRQTREESDWKPMRIVDDPNPRLQSLEVQ